MIHVCFGIHDRTQHYSKFTGTAMLSVFANTNEKVTAHILHDNTLAQKNIDKFSAMAKQYNQRVKFYNVETLCADELARIKRLAPSVAGTRYSIATFYRFLIPQMFTPDIEKIIYLDSDIIVNLDIAELWQIDLGDKPLAAAPEAVINYLDHPFYAKTKFLMVKKLVAYEDYFNAGVLSMNLNFLRGDEKNLTHGLEFLNAHPEMENFDQDALNYLYAKDCVKLPEKFDVFIGIERRTPSRKNKLRKAIYHYAGQGMGFDMRDPFNRLWMDYFIKTPWFDAETVGKIYADFQKNHVDLKDTLIKITALMSGKYRGFVVPKSDLETIRKIFYIRDDEEVIGVDQTTSRQEIFDKMNASRGKKIFFVFVPNFPFVNFQKLGFVYGKDFLNGLEFLSGAQNLNSYLLLKEL